MVRQGALVQIKTALHRRLDPLLSMGDHWRAALRLSRLPDGEYRAAADVPYYAQYASPELIYDYIHHGYDGANDPNWPVFGSREPSDYVFWAPRICALAVLKMAIEAFDSTQQPTLWQLVIDGLKHNGYAVRDAHGRWIDQGWYVDAQLALAAQYGLRAEPRGYVSPLTICRLIRQGWLVAATVTPQLGEREPSGNQYGGHLVLVHGFVWEQRLPTHYILHNPSGRFEELRAGARIPAHRFHASFAHRLIALRPARSALAP